MILCWPWPTLQKDHLCSLMLLYEKMIKYKFLWKLLKAVNWKLVQIVDLISEYMIIYEYQRSRSLFDLCPRSLEFILLHIFNYEASRPIDTKFYIEFLWIKKMKFLFKWFWSCDQDDHHGKNPLKIFSKTSMSITFTLGIQHQGLGPYKFCSNDDPGWCWPTLQQGP